jgi:hypothetical protein
MQKYKRDIEKYNFVVVVYGCETWLLTLRKKIRLRVFENRDEVTWTWRKVHNREMNDLCSPKIVRVIKSKRMDGRGM